MRWKKPGIWLGIASTLFVVGFVAWDSKRISAGELSAVHSRARDGLESDCSACHASGSTTMASACAGCHEDVSQQIAAHAGLHGTMAADASTCGTCHSEHHGLEHTLVSDETFTRAGVPDRVQYRHEELDFGLAGMHVDLSCDRCHEHANDAVLMTGTKRFLGESQACASCHHDPHAGHLPDCAACHGQSVAFELVASFVHPESFSLTGRHADIGCQECHPKGSEFAVEASGIAHETGKTTRSARACVDCHASPHAQDFVAKAAQLLTIDLAGSCAACHSTENGAFRGSAARMDDTLHASSGFALEPPHAEATCAQCHAASPMLVSAPARSSSIEQFHALHPGRRADECKACHADPHGGQFAQGTFAAANCRECHEATRFEPADFDVSDHARTSFSLTGSHEAVACSACHEQPSPTAPRKFHGTDTACSSCHADAHAGFFDRTGTPAIFSGEAGCARCHDTSTFGAVKTRAFDHELWTGFALAGAHARSACAVCHPSTKVADAAGRTFGRVADAFTGSTSECSTCHADVHAGHFVPGMVAQRAAGGAGCASCHDVESFQTARKNFEHADWTAFALTGAHARAQCEACHLPRDRADADGRRFGLVSEQFSGPSNRCDTCHVDVHGGRISKSSCASCHSTETFNEVPKSKFDHASATGFPLDGLHAQVECAACHAPNDSPTGRTFGRAKGTSCQSCHADSHVAQFAVDGVTNCTRCHSTAASFDRPSFDHARDSKFALDATHAALDCARCHVPTPLANGGTAIRYKPLGTACADCHVPARK